MARPQDIDFIDVSPKQLVSVAAALIPFLENDDANRALMGSNMQRQAVPLIRAEAPLVGTGMEETVARDSAASPSSPGARAWSTRSTACASSSAPPRKPRPPRRASTSTIFSSSSARTRTPASPSGRWCASATRSRPATSSATGPRRSSASWRLGRNVLCAFMPWNGYNFEDSILISERIVSDDVFTSIHIEEFEVMARDTKLGQEEITRDIPNVGEEALKNLDEAGIVYIGAEVKPGDILVGKVTPKGESPMTPEEKLLRAIFGEKASDVRDTSLRLPPGVSGTIVEVRVFSRRGVDKDERALAIERAEIERLAKDRDDERTILERSFYRAPEAAADRPGSDRRAQGAEGRHASSARTVLSELTQGQWRQIAVKNDKRMADIEALKKLMDDSIGAAQAALREQGREAAARRRTAARRDEDGQGLRRGEAQAAARRQDGRPPRQQGRDLAHHAGRGHALSRGRHAGRHRAQSAGRAEPHECRPDSRDPSRLGLGRARPPDRRHRRQGAAHRATRRANCGES